MESERVVKVLESGDPEEASDMKLAMEIGDLLQKEYPNHPWVVSFQARGMILRHLAIASEVHRVIGKDGFASLLPRESLGTPKQIRSSVIRFAGELLEAFKLPRGAWDGRVPEVPDWRRGKERNFT